jgi:hypothetical protein
VSDGREGESEDWSMGEWLTWSGRWRGWQGRKVMLADLEESRQQGDRRVVELLRIQNVSERRNNSFRL